MVTHRTQKIQTCEILTQEAKPGPLKEVSNAEGRAGTRGNGRARAARPPAAVR